MTSEFKILSLENEAFCAYIVCTCLLVLKMMGVTLLTIYTRFKYKAFISQEDAEWAGGEVVVNDQVERMRRVHQNDLENIPVFIAVSFAYLWTSPSVWAAIVLYFGFTIVRGIHTIVYVLRIPQPTRASIWLIGFLITGYMAIHAAIYAFIYLVS